MGTRRTIEDRLISEGRIVGKNIFAPNGQKSQLYENLLSEQGHEKAYETYLNVHSDNFKNWFGDWENSPETASKVVDERGEPLMLYHGTSNYGFDKFDKSILGKNTNSTSSKKGFYFTPNVIVSWAYANGHAADVVFFDKEEAEVGKKQVLNFPHEQYKKLKEKMIPRKIIEKEKKFFGLYNKKKLIRNDEFYETLREATYGFGEQFREDERVVSGKIIPKPEDSMYRVFLNIKNMPHLDYSNDFIPTDENGFIDTKGWWKVWEKFDMDLNELNNNADGVMVDGLLDRGGFCLRDSIIEKQYLVFEPRQIKSINNKGYFSVESENIFK